MTQPPVSPEDQPMQSSDPFVPEHASPPISPSSPATPADPAPSATPPATRDADLSDAPPPSNAPGRGLMGQLIPDVPTGSTPVTRHDD